MEMELEPRVKPLAYKVKAMSRETTAQKAPNVLDPDLRTHWSTGTNTKEWILLELDEPCLLSHLRIYNKSVLEWEVTVGLRYKPEAFVKVRPRCEAPRRDMMYPMNYTPCRYVRISCLRGNPIAIFFIQLIGISVTGLEPEFQPVVNYLLPHIISHKQEANDMHFQLLQDMTNRLLFFLPQLETDLNSFTDAAESNMRFFAMLAGPFYPILHIAKEREASKAGLTTQDSDAFRNNQTSTLTVSSNFEAQRRRLRSSSSSIHPDSSFIAFRSDAVIMLLKNAYKDPHLGIVCRIASRALQKFIEPIGSLDESIPHEDTALTSASDETAKIEALSHYDLADYSSLFGEEFKIPDDQWDTVCLNILDIAAVEEGIFHLLFACASNPLLCCKLADSSLHFWSILPLIQALLPALRPPLSSPLDQVDNSFSQWKHHSVQLALSQIVTMLSSTIYHPLLRACAGYLSSFSSSHAKAACVLIDLCSGSLSPWIPTITAKVDLAIDLMEDLLGIIQGGQQSVARAALKYIILALSGNMDDVLAKYKENKHKLLFLVEMLEPFLDPAITAMKNTIAFGDVSAIFLEKQERTCATALNVIRTAVQRPAVLPSLESEWRRGSVAPSVLLSILGPHMPLPSDIDHCKCSVSKAVDHEPLQMPSCINESDGKIDTSETTIKSDGYEDPNFLFASPELKKTVLTAPSNHFVGSLPDKSVELSDSTTEGKHMAEKISANEFQLDNSFFLEYYNVQENYLQLVNYQDCEVRASEFQRLAMDLCSQHDSTPEGHAAAIDALLLAAECYVNPFFMISFRSNSKLIDHMATIKSKMDGSNDVEELCKDLLKSKSNLEAIAHLEAKRDKTVLQILLQAAKLDRDYQMSTTQSDHYPYDPDDKEQGINILPQDLQFADAITLVRQNQALLCHFVTQQLQREQYSSHEILLQCLLFLLHSATELSCPPEYVIDIILQSAENLNVLLSSLYCQVKEGNMHICPEKLHVVQRQWALLQKMVIASSGNDDHAALISKTRNGFQFRHLVPPSSWMNKISSFSNNSCPLPRFLGWMAISRYAKQYLTERLFLASDLSQLTPLLCIFSDELALTDIAVNQKAKAPERFDTKHCLQWSKDLGPSNHSDGQESFHVVHPDLHKFFPNMKKHFGTFGEVILEAVGLQLKCLPVSAIPDVLCWFSDLCVCPYPESAKYCHYCGNSADCLKGHMTTSAKAIVLYLLESILSAHMEAMVPEMPRVAQILISMCKASYCDVAFLDSVLHLLRPLMSYYLRKVTDVQKPLTDVFSSQDFELNFEELFDSISRRNGSQDGPREKKIQGSLMIFTFGSLFADLTFRRKREILRSLLEWVDFTSKEPVSSFYDYLCAFQKVMDSCYIFLVQNLNALGIIVPFERNKSLGSDVGSLGGNSNLPSELHDKAAQRLPFTAALEFDSNDGASLLVKGIHYLSVDEIQEISEGLEALIFKLIAAIEASWKLHPQLTSKLTTKSAECLLFSKCLNSISQAGNISQSGDGSSNIPSIPSDLSSKHWVYALEGLTGVIITSQQNQCWQVSSAILEYQLSLPQAISLDCVICSICSAIKHFTLHAPRISWRLQTDKWLSCLFTRGISNLGGNETSLVDLFCTMLGHPEPEQRAVALQHLGRIVGLDTSPGAPKLSYTFHQSSIGADSALSIPESLVSFLVLNTWDRVAALALSDSSMLLKSHAMALLSGYIPFAERSQLQSFFVATNTILRGMGRLSPSMEEGHLSRLSLGLLASMCLYSPNEDVALIPESVWRNLESMGMPRTGGLDDSERKLSKALCKLRTESDSAKADLKEALSLHSAEKDSDPNFRSTRESILQVLASLTSIQSYFNFFSKKMDQESQELEEAEIEVDLLQKERALHEISSRSKEEMSSNLPFEKNNDRLRQIKDEIQSLERSKLREEILVRRQKKLLMRQARQKYLEEAASREMELLQELDRERTNELEHELERQKLLELERAKSRELQFNLDMEKERQTQRELQRELEQLESGVRSSRREFSSNPSSRTRERYRERDIGRPGNEGSLRPSSRGRESGTPQTATSGPGTASAPTVVLSGSRSFSGHLPTILQSRDRADERSTSYEDSFEGGRDSGDASSIGDPDLASAFDGLGGGFGSAPRHGSRGSKSRQVVERRERDGRREGKWERKNS